MSELGMVGVAPINILVVDDHAENRLALKAILDSPRYRFLEAATEKQALRHLLREDCALILLDVVMPGVDGFELAALIKQRERAAAVPIIFLSAHAMDEEAIRRAYRAGAVDYIGKPLLPEVVRAKVAVFAELYRQRLRIKAQAGLLLEAERKESAGRLVELRVASDRRYRSLAEAVPHIVWTAQADGRVDYFNRRWFEFTGLSSADSHGGWLSAVHADDRLASEAAWLEAIARGEPFEAECRLRRRDDGSSRWYLCRALPERGPSGEVVSWLGTFTDVDDQKRVQTVLAELKGMLDAVADAVLIFDARSGAMVYVNQGATGLLGYSQAELMAVAPLAVMPELAHEDLGSLLAPLADGRASFETVYRRKNGSEVAVELSLQQVDSHDGRIIAIARDISERKQSEEMREFLYRRALDAVQARDEFLSIASHELRTPLTSLTLQVESLLRLVRRGGRDGQEPAAPMLAGKLDVAARQVGRLIRLIDELLDVSRITSGQFRVEREPVDLAAMARDVVTRFADDAQQAGCEIEIQADEAVTGQWDRVRLEQVITNLFTNALKFGAGKPVELRIEADADKARLSVRDHGIGVAADAQVRVFERFERGPSARGFGGLGLGLYIAQRIVAAHGGSIELRSEPGDGALFAVTLPRQPPAEKGTDLVSSRSVPVGG